MTANAIKDGKIRKVTWMPQHEAEDVVPLYGLGMISITGTEYDRARLQKGWRDLLRLEFDDIEEPAVDSVLFDVRMADRVLDWLDEVDGHVEEIVVHCWAGISRSAAVARFVAERYRVEAFDFEYRCYNDHVYNLLALRWQLRYAGKTVACR